MATRLIVLFALLFVAAATAADRPARSQGYYSSGTLTGAEALAADGPNHYLVFDSGCYRGRLSRHYPDKTRADNFFGHPHTVAAVRDVSASLRRRHPQAPRVPVGELSNRDGGQIRTHLSHQNGLDVDVYFLRTAGLAGLPFPRCEDGPSYEAKDADGVWSVTEDFRHDWNWTLVSEFARRRDVRRIFIGGLLKDELARWAKAARIPARQRRRTLSKLHAVFCKAPPGIRTTSYKNNLCPHDDHIHVRFWCPPDSPGCKNRR